MKLVFFLLLLSASLNCHAQADVQVWNKWCAKKDTLLLFNGGNNVIQIYCPSIKPADIKLKSLDKALRIGLPEIKGDTLVVMAMPFPDKGKNMRLAIQYKKNSREIKTVSFVSDSIPQPTAMVGNLRGAEATKKDILVQTGLRVFFPGSLYSYPYTVKQYTFKIAMPNEIATIPVRGNFLGKDILAEINKAPAGTMINFTDIKATCPDCATRAVPDIKMKIR